MFKLEQQDSFVSKTPKTRKRRIIVEERPSKPEINQVQPLENAKKLEETLQQSLKTRKKENSLILNEVKTPFDFGITEDSKFFELVRCTEIVKCTQEIFGEQLSDIVSLISVDETSYTYEQRVSILYHMFTQATENSGKKDNIAKIPDFLVYAKTIFPPSQMQEISILCGKRINDIAMELVAKNPKSLKPLQKQATVIGASISPRASSETISPRSLTHESSDIQQRSPRKKPRRGNSLKNLFQTTKKLTDGDITRSFDFSNLQPRAKSPRKIAIRAASDLSSSDDNLECSSQSSPKLSALSSPRISLSSVRRSQRIQEITLSPLFDNQVNVFGDWNNVDPSNDKKELKLMTRLWDHHYECGGYSNEELSSNLSIDSYWMEEPVFENNFHGKNLYNYISQESPDNIVVVSIACTNEKNPKMIIVMTIKESLQLRAPAEYRFKDILKAIGTMLDIPTNFVRCKDPTLENHILKFESGNRIKNYKFGILYCKDGQTDENDMFANNEVSDEYNQFLDFIGNRIPLFGWKKFRGGLDVKTKTTGDESIYSIHGKFEIMFHVASLLPFYEADTQQLERKRHLGNDVVVIIYKEGNQKFDPSCLHSEFNHVFIVIQKVSKEEEIDDKPTYRVEIAHKGDIPHPPLPLLPEKNLFHLDESFRRLLLTKMINGERMAMRSKQFSLKLKRTRKMLLRNICESITMTK